MVVTPLALDKRLKLDRKGIQCTCEVAKRGNSEEDLEPEQHQQKEEHKG
jgi:hypothetical protein